MPYFSLKYSLYNLNWSEEEKRFIVLFLYFAILLSQLYWKNSFVHISNFTIFSCSQKNVKFQPNIELQELLTRYKLCTMYVVRPMLVENFEKVMCLLKSSANWIEMVKLHSIVLLSPVPPIRVNCHLELSGDQHKSSKYWSFITKANCLFTKANCKLKKSED